MAKVYNFIGADHKVGVTQIVQSIADAFVARKIDKGVLVLHFDGREGAEYMVKPANAGCIDDIYGPLMQHLAQFSEISELLIRNSNNEKDMVFTLVGSRLNDNAVRYTPQVARDIIKTVSDYFDYILIDSGANLNWNGLAVGAFEYEEEASHILITTQQEAAYTNFVLQNDIRTKFNTGLDALIINKFAFATGKFLMSEKQVCEKYGFRDAYTVFGTETGIQSESDHKSLYLMDKGFKKDINILIDSLIKA